MFPRRLLRPVGHFPIIRCREFCYLFSYNSTLHLLHLLQNGASSDSDEEKRSRCGEIVANIDKYEVVVFPSHVQEDQAQ